MVFDVVRQDEHGRPTRLGAPSQDAQRAHFVLKDGSTMALTMCSSCLAGLTPADYPVIWQNVLEAFRQEIKLLEARDPDHHDQRVQMAIKLASNVPLGIIAAERWKDLAR
jgi:hypothetical protein